MTTETPIRWKELSARERDALVAEYVMGTQGIKPILVIDGKGKHKSFGTTRDYTMVDGRQGREAKALPKYSESTEAAFQVVEKMREKGFEVSMDNARGYWWCMFQGEGTRSKASSESLPDAICISALRHIGLTIEMERTWLPSSP